MINTEMYNVIREELAQGYDLKDYKTINSDVELNLNIEDHMVIITSVDYNDNTSATYPMELNRFLELSYDDMKLLLNSNVYYNSMEWM